VLARKITVFLLVCAIGVSAIGCGNKASRMKLKQAEMALEKGNVQAAIRNTKMVLSTSPRNILAKRMLKKIEAKLIEDTRDALAAKKYKEAVASADLVLNKIDAKNEEIKAMRDKAKKYLHLNLARKTLADDNPLGAIKYVKEALKLDPNFKEAKELEAEAQRQVKDKIANLMTVAKELIANEQYEALRDMAQDILEIAPQNREVADLLRDALDMINQRDKERNLEGARLRYEEGMYESAKAKAELVLKADPNNEEAKKIVEHSRQEMAKPGLRLGAFYKIKGMVIAHIQVLRKGDPDESYRVKEGDVFDDFEVTVIDYDLKAVVVKYTRTGSLQTLRIGSE